MTFETCTKEELHAYLGIAIDHGNIAIIKELVACGADIYESFFLDT